MFIACWSVKGGSGTTVVATSLALLAARGGGPRRRGRSGGSVLGQGAGALLVDLAGDIPAAIGRPEPMGPGVADWLRAGLRVPPDGWGRLETAIDPGLGLVPRGLGPLADPGRAEVLAGILGADGRTVVVDCGIVRSEPVRRPVLAGAEVGVHDERRGLTSVAAPWSDGGDRGGLSAPDEVPLVLASAATVSLLVIRPCYLALRRATAAAIAPSGVVVVSEPERSLSAGDIEDVLGVPVVAEIDYDPAVARAVDSGLLAHRLPRGLERSLRDAA